MGMFGAAKGMRQQEAATGAPEMLGEVTLALRTRACGFGTKSSVGTSVTESNAAGQHRAVGGLGDIKRCPPWRWWREAEKRSCRGGGG